MSLRTALPTHVAITIVLSTDLTVDLALTAIETRPDLGWYLGVEYANTMRLRPWSNYARRGEIADRLF
jgi:hypothetical protein